MGLIPQGHGAWISDAAITKCGSHVVTVSGDETGILWNAKTGEMITGGGGALVNMHTSKIFRPLIPQD